MRDCGSRLFRQKMELLDYNFKILHHPGNQNVVADALSRIGPLTIEEMINIEEKRAECRVLTRSQAKGKFKQLFNYRKGWNNIKKTQLRFNISFNANRK